MPDPIVVAPGVRVLPGAIEVHAVRSSGPGGQNVNKLSTRVTVLFDIRGCASLSDTQKARIRAVLANRIDKESVLRVVCQKHRTQQANRRGAVERLQQLLAEALKTRPARIETRVPYAARQRRLERKKQRGMLKCQRTRRNLPGDFAD